MREVLLPYFLMWIHLIEKPDDKTAITLQKCVNELEHCTSWASIGECKKSPVLMGLYCRKSCGACGFRSRKSHFNYQYLCAQRVFFSSKHEVSPIKFLEDRATRISMMIHSVSNIGKPLRPRAPIFIPWRLWWSISSSWMGQTCPWAWKWRERWRRWQFSQGRRWWYQGI